MFLNVHVEALASLTLAQQLELVPPPDAVKVAKPMPKPAGALPNGEPAKVDPSTSITVSPAVTQGQLLHKIAPAYPADAKRRGVHGIVVIKATIGTDGHIWRMSLVSAPDPLLAEAAGYAVSQWEYKPYLLLGEPVEVETTINVAFSLGGL
jgi:periplasmic protein TonB